MLKVKILCFLSDLKDGFKSLLVNFFGIEIRRAKKGGSMVQSKVSSRAIKSMIIQKKLAVMDNQVTWFYTAYERGGKDPLTNYALNFIENEIDKEANILITGCGTGIMLFHLADKGFKKISGFDYLKACVDIANEISRLGNYDTSIYQDDGFNPNLGNKQYDVITALHWVFSAWMGNYGNNKLTMELAYSNEYRTKVLEDFIGKYADNIRKGGYLIIELTDSVTDYRIPMDHYLGDESKDIYPIRHSPEQVEKCSAKFGFYVVTKNLSVSYGHHPRTQYILKKL